MVANKYTPAAASQVAQDARRDEIRRQFDEAWDLVRNPPPAFVVKTDAASVDDIKAQEEARRAHDQKVAEYNARRDHNPFYNRVLAEHNKRVIATANTPAEQRQTVIDQSMAQEISAMKEGAIQSAFSKSDRVIPTSELPKLQVDLGGMAPAASSALMSSIFSGDFSGALGSAANAAKGSFFSSLISGITDWIRGTGKQIFMYTGHAEQVKSMVSGLPKWAGGEGEKKSVEASLKEFHDQQAILRMAEDGFIVARPQPVVLAQATPAEEKAKQAAEKERQKGSEGGIVGGEHSNEAESKSPNAPQETKGRESPAKPAAAPRGR